MTRRWPLVLVPFLAAVVVFGQEPKTAPVPGAPTAAPIQHSADDELIVDGHVLGPAVEPRADDTCIVCKKPLGNEGVVYLVKGNRVPLHLATCYNAFVRDPQKFLAALPPRGAFLGSGSEKTHPSIWWFLGGLYVLVGLVFAALCANRALSAGLNPVEWFKTGLLLNAFGYLMLLRRARTGDATALADPLGKAATTYAPAPCWQCGTLNHPAADKCIECGNKLQATISSEVSKAGLQAH